MTKSETEQLRAVLGAMKPDTDPRIDQPLVDQFRKLIEWATSPRPADFRRTVPVHRDDHDILLCNVLTKLVDRIEMLDATAAARLRRIDEREAER